MIETSLMVHDYPQPDDVEEITVKGKITLEINFEDDFSVNLDSEEIKEIIKDNLMDYIDYDNIENIDIDF